MVSDRGLEVLGAIVHDYVSTKEPVGSKAIVDRHNFGVSAATIRNDMAVLEDEDLIVAPHTSSGRVPTDKGYRLFVDRLQRAHGLTSAQRQAISSFLDPAGDLEDVLHRSVRLLSQLTSQLAVVQYPGREVAAAARVELVDVADRRVLVILILESGSTEQRVLELAETITEAERRILAASFSEAVKNRESDIELHGIEDRERRRVVTDAAARIGRVVGLLLRPRATDRLVVAGTSNLVRTESDFSGSIMPVLEAIEEQVTLLRLFGEMTIGEQEVAASIGREHSGFIEEASIVTGAYGPSGTEIARVGIVGPTRMDYARNMAAVRAVARYLSRLLSEDV
ncbi:heat-inducible transcriptional repressor HrcA [uncultured Agrococcus sp.]|uniref:heat-inducible transcriptional repressor HrcA n=1 Tax=uncultured Agrococcus sp. TaxID=382258 RepID=UPI0025FBE220|nr:heat-inducible transcriptional repressor HrcA [uncultured Agrococcus sp.]